MHYHDASALHKQVKSAAAWTFDSAMHCAEVNASPSLSTDTTADHQLKWGLVEDALGLVDVEGKLEGQLPLSFGG